MLYAIICRDKPGALDTRKANREAHLAHIHASKGAIVQAGPFLDSGGQMCGSLLIFEGEDQAEAEAWAADDPYAKAGLFESVEIRPWNRVLGG
ncbi:MAG: YciI family protein [Pseudomonadota bacterium]